MIDNDGTYFMCRLFGFRSVLESKMHRSLLHAENALMFQSENHPDGWGVVYYHDNCPHIIKSIETAVDDTLFQKVSGVVASKTVLAHLRKSTIGKNSILNTHPFQFGRWVFAHNGNIKNFDKLKDKLLNLVDSSLRSYLLGSTDSEILFLIFISEINKALKSPEAHASADDLKTIMKNSLKKITSVTGPHSKKDNDPPSETFLSVMLTNGSSMVAYNGGKTINYSTHKSSCPDKKECPFFNQTCENLPKEFSGKTKVNHLILSSEIIQGANQWFSLPVGEMIGVDDSMNIFREIN